MKARIFRSTPEKVKKAILEHNLATEKGKNPEWGNGSGSVDYIMDGKEIVGGYIVKDKLKTLGWGVKFINGEFHLYTVPELRKKGIGSRIVKRSKKDFPESKFCPWNHNSLTFFKKRDIKYTKEYLPFGLLHLS